MRPTVLTAREWVVRNQAAILAACSGGAEEVGGRDRQAGQAARVGTFGQPMWWSEESDLCSWVVDGGCTCAVGTQEGRGRWSWEREDLIVHFATGGWAGMSLSVYTAAIALAMVSYFTGR